MASAPKKADKLNGKELAVLVTGGFTRRAAVSGLVGVSAVPYIDQAVGGVADTQPDNGRSAGMVPPGHIYVDIPLATAEAGVATGAMFKLFSSGTGVVDVRKRTAAGSDLLYQETTAAALAGANGATQVGFQQVGDGAVKRTLESKLGDAVSVKDFGAVGDDKADDTAAIQAALDASRDVFVPAGTYRITAPLEISSFTRLYGTGESSRIKTVLDIVMLQGKDPSVLYAPIIEHLAFDNQFPVSFVEHSRLTGKTVAGSPTVSVSSLSGLTKAMAVSGPGIPANAAIRHVSRTGGFDVTLCDLSYNAPIVNATRTGSATLVLSYRQGQTNFHIYFKNSIRAQFYNVVFNSAFRDSDYSPKNHAGIWLDRTPGSSHFVASIEGCFFNKGQILCGVSDSNIKNSIIWSNPFDYSIKLSAPGGTVNGCNVSAGAVAAILTASTEGEPNGGLNHVIVGNNIDGGGIWYSGHGVLLLQPVNVNVSGNRINLCQEAGVHIRDAINCIITANGFLKNNEDDAFFSDIENVGKVLESSRNNVTGNSFFALKKDHPGHAIREINDGAAPVLNCYSSNTISANYASPPVVVERPFFTENSLNIGAGTNGTTNFVPSLVNVVVGNGVATGWYKRHGSQVTLYAKLVFGSTTSVTGNMAVTLPVPATTGALGMASASDARSDTQYVGGVRIKEASTQALVTAHRAKQAFWNATVPFGWSAGDTFEMQITFNV